METPGTIKLSASARVCFVLVSLYIGFELLVVARGLLIPLAFSLLLALLLYPMCKWFELRKFPRALSILICMALSLSVLSLVVILIINELTSFSGELGDISTNINILLNDLQLRIQQYVRLSPEHQLDWLNKRLGEQLEGGESFIKPAFQATSGFVTGVLLVPVYIFFLLYYRDFFKEFFFRVNAPERHEQIGLMLAKIQRVVMSYLVGLVTVMSIVAVLNLIGLLIIGVNHAVFFALVAALLAMIPYLGVFIGSMLPVIYTLAMSGSWVDPLLVFAWFTGVQTIEGNLISPNIIGSKVSMNPMVAIVALLVGAQVWGVAGMVTFVPFAAILKVIMDQIEDLQPYGLLLGAEHKSLQFKDIFRNIRSKYISGQR